MRKVNLETRKLKIGLQLRKLDVMQKLEKLKTDMRAVNSEIKSHSPRRSKPNG